MERIIDLEQSRLARVERQEQFKQAAEDLMGLLERYRGNIPEEFMAFLLAMGLSEQAMHYANEAGTAEAGQIFLEQVADTTQQLFEIHLAQPGEKITPSTLKTRKPNGEILNFTRQQNRQPLD